ncbi:MAG TPA: SusC/RagA family TonB-linked outer membrane protein [Longimicrobium sp.]|nr:SusC/RagA family TonB-linked outer membrane protein [Longimicrobium sp.]
MSRIRWIATILLAAALPTAANAQSGGTITGRVTDSRSGAPLSSTTVLVAGTTLRVVTNAQGEYRIGNVPSGSQSVTASRIGYAGGTQRVTVAAGQTVTANFSLNTSAVNLNALVVQASGREARQRELGNAVSNITADQVPQATVQNFSQFLQGRAPGVVVTQSSGQLGSNSRIRIRGVNSLSLNNDPLIIIDGVRIGQDAGGGDLFSGGQGSSRLNDLNPDDIESVEVLKGPAASALYGTQAANGVIQVTTKRGRAGRPNVRAYSEFSNLEENFDFPDNYLQRGFNAAGTRINCDLASRAAGTCVKLDSLYSYNPLESDVTPLQTGALTKLGGSVSGGTETATYYVSGETTHGVGVQHPNHLSRRNVRANLAANAGSTLRLTASAGYTANNIQLPQSDNSSISPLLWALRGAPTPTNIANNAGYGSGILASQLYKWENKENSNRFTGSVTGNYRPLTWLSFNGTLGVDNNDRFIGTFVAPGSVGAFPGGFREQYRTHNNVFTANAGATATNQLRSNLAATTSAGVQWTSANPNYTYAEADDPAPGTILGGIPGSVDENLGPEAPDRLFGAYISEQLAINDRLFLNAAIRGDKSSASGADIGFITYPSLSASWVVNEEPWFPSMGQLSNLRLRAAYGKSGLRPAYLTANRTYNTAQVALDGGVASGFVVSNFGNSELKAEITREIEFGGDLGMFDDRVSLEVTHYNKRSNNALVSRTLAPSFGGPLSQYFNLGSVSNSGLEMALRTQPVRRRNLEVNLDATLATNRNRLNSFGDTIVAKAGISLGTLQWHIEGYPVGAYFTTAYRYSDANGDGLIQQSEVVALPADSQTIPSLNRTFFGSPLPKREASFNADVRAFGFARVSALLDYKGGQKLFDQTRQSRCTAASTVAFCQERWVPGASLEDQAAIQAVLKGISSAGFIEDASFWKLREVALTLTAPNTLTRRFGFREDGLSLTLAGRNLHTWTNYRGFDPEVNANGTTNLNANEFYSVPPARSLVARIDVNF